MSMHFKPSCLCILFCLLDLSCHRPHILSACVCTVADGVKEPWYCSCCMHGSHDALAFVVVAMCWLASMIELVWLQAVQKAHAGQAASMSVQRLGAGAAGLILHDLMRLWQPCHELIMMQDSNQPKHKIRGSLQGPDMTPVCRHSCFMLEDCLPSLQSNRRLLPIQLLPGRLITALHSMPALF